MATDIKIGEDDQTKIDFETADEIHFYAANAEQVFVSDGVFGPQTDSDVESGFESGAQDVFGVSIGFVFDAMEPIGANTDNNLDLGQSGSI